MRSLGIVVTLICGASLASPGHALDFNLGADNRTVFASGVIDGDAATRFAAFVSASRLDNATGITVVLNSPGGRLRGGLGLGNAIRAKQWNTLVGRGVALRGGDQGENSASIRMRTLPVVAGRREGVARP
jgi:hypothetical protein